MNGFWMGHSPTILRNALELWLFAQDLHKIVPVGVPSWMREEAYEAPPSLEGLLTMSVGGRVSLSSVVHTQIALPVLNNFHSHSCKYLIKLSGPQMEKDIKIQEVLTEENTNGRRRKTSVGMSKNHCMNIWNCQTAFKMRENLKKKRKKRKRKMVLPGYPMPPKITTVGSLKFWYIHPKQAVLPTSWWITCFDLSLIHIRRCRRSKKWRSRWSP